MTLPTTSEPSEMTTPAQNSVQCGVGIRATPPRVMPTRATRTAVQAAGDDPCMRPTLPGLVAECGVVALILRTPEVRLVRRLGDGGRFTLVAR